MTTSSTETIFLHVPHQPANPPSQVLHHHFRISPRHPCGKIPLPRLHDKSNCSCRISCLKSLRVTVHQTSPTFLSLRLSTRSMALPFWPALTHMQRSKEGQAGTLFHDSVQALQTLLASLPQFLSPTFLWPSFSVS
jgi:hypothetical protein